MKKLDTGDLCGKLDMDRGFNMNTCCGKPMWPADPRADDIRINDIAGSLSRICRFNGHMKDCIEIIEHVEVEDSSGYCTTRWQTIETFSVAQHSLNVEREVSKVLDEKYARRSASFCRKIKLAALLHDATEFIHGDMIKPQKRMYAEREQYEAEGDAAIAARFGFDPGLFKHPLIKNADYRMFLTEKRDLCNEDGTDFGVADAEPYDEQIIPVLPSVAKAMFLKRFHELYKGE